MQTIHNNINQSLEEEDGEDDFIEFVEQPELDIKLEDNDFGEHTNNTVHPCKRPHSQQLNSSDTLNELAMAKRADEKFELVSLIRSKYDILYGKYVDRSIKEATWQWILEECLRRGHGWAVGKEANYMRKSKWPGIKSDALRRYNEELVTGKANRMTLLDKFVLEFLSPESIQQSVRNTTTASPQIVLAMPPTLDKHNSKTDLNGSSSDQQQHQTKTFSNPSSLAAFLWEKSTQEIALADNNENPSSPAPPTTAENRREANAELVPEDAELVRLQKECLHSKMQRNRFQTRYYRLKSCLVKRQLKEMDRRSGGNNK